MPSLSPLLPLLLFLTLLPSTLAWGREGHQIVATIAQIHLHPNALSNICKVLPPSPGNANGASGASGGCHLADVAAWADAIKGRMPWTGPMHYINPLNDHPGETCNFGQDGWTNAKVNVITAIHEKVAVLLNGTRDHRDEEALKFLIHFMGDMHQPLHLTGYLRGGNDAWVRWFGRRQKLHSVWDGSILNEKIAALGNYTGRTSSKQLESALTGQRYDPYIRFIVKEGIWGWWNQSSRSWFDCPSDGDHFPLTPSPTAGNGILSTLKSGVDLLVSFLPSVAQTSLFDMGFASPIIPGFEERVNSSAEGWSPACPYTWAKQIHPINCQYAWPEGFVQHGKDVELDDGEYLPRLTRDKIMESMLAKGGIRLAAILNAIYAHDDVAPVEGLMVPEVSAEEREKRIREWARPYWREEYDRATRGWFAKWFPIA